MLAVMLHLESSHLSKDAGLNNPKQLCLSALRATWVFCGFLVEDQSRKEWIEVIMIVQFSRSRGRKMKETDRKILRK